MRDGGFPFFTNGAAINILGLVFLWTYFHFSSQLLRNGIVRSYAKCMFAFIKKNANFPFYYTSTNNI